MFSANYHFMEAGVRLKKVIVALSIVMMIAVIVLCIHIQDEDSISSVHFTVKTNENVPQNINLHHREGKYYAFLPSYTNLDNMRISHRTGLAFYLDGKHYHSESSFADIVLDREYAAEIKTTLGISVLEAVVIFMQADQVPALSITLTNGSLEDIHTDKTLTKSGYLSLIEAGGNVNFAGELRQFHGRGNSSWDRQKKPYTLEFDHKVNLLNMGEHQKYVLIANAMDRSNLRNKIIYDAAITLGLPNSVRSEYVDLYIDGNYVGLYLLTNKISILENDPQAMDLEAATQKLNQNPLKSYPTFSKTVDGVYTKGFSVDRDPKDITGSYLLEFELDIRVGDVYNLLTTKSGQSLAVKSPRYASEAQMDYIGGFIQDMENRLGTEEIWTIVDEESWSKYYLLQELSGNVSLTSVFFYKHPDSKGGQLIAGPLWDFDLSMGTAFESENSLPYALYCNWGWFEKYNSNAACMDKIKERYLNEVRPVFQDIISRRIDAYQAFIEKSYLMNAQRWGAPEDWWVNDYPTQEGHSRYLKNYLSERLKYLDHLWLGYEKPQEVMQNEAIRPVTKPQPSDSSQPKPEGIMEMLNVEPYYYRYGTLLLTVAVLAFVGADAVKSLRARRKSNGRKP